MENKHLIDFRYAPPSSWTNIGLKDDIYKSIVREDGALLYGFQSESFGGWSFKRVYEFAIRAAHGPKSVSQVTVSSRFPCTVTTLEYAKATLQLKTFAHRDGEKRTDVVLWSIHVNEDVSRFLTGLTVNIFELSRYFMGRSTAPARVIFAVDVDKKPSQYVSIVTNGYEEEDESQPGPGEIAFVSVPHHLIPTHSAGFRPCSAVGIEPVVLQGGQELTGALIFPQNYTDDQHLTMAWAEKAYEDSRIYWEEMPLFKLPFQIPDPAIMDMLQACARNIFQAREIKDNLPVFQVGATCYRGLWVVDGHFLLEAAHYMGFQDDAYQGVDTLLKRVKEDGSIAEFPYHTKETGISILTLIRQCELMQDEARLRDLWPTICNAVAYIEGMRKEAYELPENDPCYKLLPMSFADGGLGGQRGEYTTVFWIMAGLKAAAQTAVRFGFTTEAGRFQTDFDDLLNDFRHHAARDMQVLADGTPYLPICMPGSGEHVFTPNYPNTVPDYVKINPASGTWAFCHAITPGEVFSPDDPLVQNLLRLYEQVDDQEGIPAFTGWIPYQALWGYNSMFAANTWLYSGRGDKAIDYLYAFANHASPTRVWREEQSLTETEEGQMVGDMPHNWGSAEFIRLARHLIVFERSNDLDLLAGIPESWRTPGAVVALEKTPTRFGPVSVRLESLENGEFNLHIQMDSTARQKPKCIRVLLPVSSVTENGMSLRLDSNCWVELSPKEDINLHGFWKM